MSARLARFVSAVLLLAATAGVACAEAGNPLTDAFSLSAGLFLLDTSTNLSVNGQGIPGTDIDLDRDLGFKDKDSFRIDGYWRFAKRHKVRIMYFDSKRSQDHVLDRDITFQGTTYPLHAEVSSRVEMTIAEVAYEYAFIQNDKWELAATAGIHDLDFKMSIAAAGGPLVVANSQSASANGPLPVVGLRGVWNLTDQIYFDAQAQFFKIKISPYDGRLENYNVSFVWRPISHVGFGAGYDYFLTRVDVDGSKFDGSLKWRYGGARIFVNVSF